MPISARLILARAAGGSLRRVDGKCWQTSTRCSFLAARCISRATTRRRGVVERRGPWIAGRSTMVGAGSLEGALRTYHARAPRCINRFHRRGASRCKRLDRRNRGGWAGPGMSAIGSDEILSQSDFQLRTRPISTLSRIISAILTSGAPTAEPRRHASAIVRPGSGDEKRRTRS
jgi:hypothetical protein